MITVLRHYTVTNGDRTVYIDEQSPWKFVIFGDVREDVSFDEYRTPEAALDAALEQLGAPRVQSPSEQMTAAADYWRARQGGESR